MVKKQNAAVMELVDIGVSKSPAGNGVRVQVPPAAPPKEQRTELLAYIVGVALGDGNLSNPNGRATRLRVTCDLKYPILIREIKHSLELLLPKNKVSLVQRPSNCVDISVYSNKLNFLIPWRVGAGTKFQQSARIPEWIFDKEHFVSACVKGLIQTDGCIYLDRGYQMVSFSNTTYALAYDIFRAIQELGFKPTLSKIEPSRDNPKYIVRVAREANRFINKLNLYKN